MAISRREFLTRASVAAAAISFPSLIPSTAFGANDRIALGCIGVGDRGTLNMRNFMGTNACRVVAVCDAQRARMEKAKGLVDQKYGDQGCAMIGDYRELLARKDIDVVMIAAQDHWHSLIATAAANAGKDMFCEKPMGVCVNDGFAIRAAIRKNKRVFQSGMWQRSLGNFRQGAELALNGYLGKITEVQVAVEGPHFQPVYKGPYDPQPVPDGFDWAMWQGPVRYSPFNPGRVAYPDWYLLNDYCEGWTTNWGVHHLDSAAGETEGGRPHRAPAEHPGEPLDRRQQESAGELLLDTHGQNPSTVVGRSVVTGRPRCPAVVTPTPAHLAATRRRRPRRRWRRTAPSRRGRTYPGSRRRPRRAAGRPPRCRR